MAPKPPAQKLFTLALDRALRSIVLVATLATLVHEVPDIPRYSFVRQELGGNIILACYPFKNVLHTMIAVRKGHAIPHPVLNSSCHKPSETTNRNSQP